MARTESLIPPREESLPSRTPKRGSRYSPTVKNAVDTWLQDGEAQGFSEKTLTDRKDVFRRFLWWLTTEAELEPVLDSLRPDVIRQFLAYCRNPNPEGRFGSSMESAKRQARPATVHRYFRELRAFNNFCVAEGFCDEGFMRNVKPPRVPPDQIQPFSEEQVRNLLNATSDTVAPERNRAIILLLLDSGLRCSELCSLRICDVRRETGELTVTGKGNKTRTVYLGTVSRRALRTYLVKCRSGADDDEALFIAEGGTKRGTGLGHSAIRTLFQDLGSLASIEGVRCSPHTLRHTFAINFLRGGGNLFELQKLMGHSDLTVLRRYVALAETDLAKAHRMASPADRMKLR